MRTKADPAKPKASRSSARSASTAKATRNAMTPTAQRAIGEAKPRATSSAAAARTAVARTRALEPPPISPSRWDAATSHHARARKKKSPKTFTISTPGGVGSRFRPRPGKLPPVTHTGRAHAKATAIETAPESRARPVARSPAPGARARTIGIRTKRPVSNGASQALVRTCTAAWDAQLLTGLFVLIPIVLALAPGAGLRATGRALLSGAVSIAVALACARPVWVTGGSFPGRGRNLEPTPPGVEIVNVFGLFFFLALAWWLVAASQRLGEIGGGSSARVRATAVLAAAALLVALGFASPIALCAVGVIAFLVAFAVLAERAEDRLAFGFAGSAFVLIAVPQRVYI